MSKKVLFPLIAVFSLGVAAGSLGCHAEAKIGNAEAKAATPPPPPEPPPPPKEEPKPVEAAPPPKAIKALGKAKIEGNEIKIPGKVHFDTDKATIKEDKETKEILQTVADVMKENQHITKLRVDGHTDDSGSSDHNHKLSQERAQSVIEWLAKAGVDKSRLDAKGWGEEHPLVKNDTAANKEQNRRVEFKLWELEGKATDAQKSEASTGGPAVGGNTATAPRVDLKDAKKDAKPTAATPAAPAAPKK
jgi:outer membrane protein OmpA-like peptidoglycan-associated protein